MHDLPVLRAAKSRVLSDDRREWSPDSRCGFRLSWPDDWWALLQTGVNVLATGPRTALKAFLRAARPALLAPVRSVAGSRPLALQTANTLIVHDVDRLSRTSQRTLFTWMNEPAQADTQIISTASTPLFPLVQVGQLDRALYYRLNTIWLEVQPSATLDDVPGDHRTAGTPEEQGPPPR